MSDRWIELLKRGYDAFNRGDIEGALAFMGPGFSGSERPESPEARTFTGDDAARQALGVLHGEFEDYRFEPLDFRVEGDWVLVTLRQSGRGRMSGIPVEGEIVHAWRVVDDRGEELRAFSTVHEALEAVGAPAGPAELVRRWCDAVSSGDWRSADGMFDPDVEFVYPGEFPGGGTHGGLDAGRAAFEAELEAWDEFRMDLLEATEAGDRVVASIRESGRGRSSGLPAEVVLHSVWTTRDGRIARVRFFRDRAEALREAGLAA